MKQNKKLIRNCWIILFGLWVMYYFGGFYLSEEKCVADILKAYYVSGETEIMSLENGKYTWHLYSTEGDGGCAVGTRRIGVLYQKESFVSDDYIKLVKERSEKEGFEYLNVSKYESGTVLFVYRYNKDIHLIHAELENGMSVVLDKWTDDYSGFALEHEPMPSGNYVGATLKAYDKNGNLLGERTY